MNLIELTEGVYLDFNLVHACEYLPKEQAILLTGRNNKTIFKLTKSHIREEKNIRKIWQELSRKLCISINKN